MNEDSEPNEPAAKKLKIDSKLTTSKTGDDVDFTVDITETKDQGFAQSKYDDLVTPEEVERLKEFRVLDEVKSNDENSDDNEESDDESEGIPEDEIEKMLEDDLPEQFKGVPKPKEKPYVTCQKIVLEEKGINQFEVLPLDWLCVRHCSGMPLYLHRPTRVATLSRPYALGKGNTKRHEIPISAIPCLSYRKALEEEAKQNEIDKIIDEQIRTGSWKDTVEKKNEPSSSNNNTTSNKNNVINVENKDTSKSVTEGLVDDQNIVDVSIKTNHGCDDNNIICADNNQQSIELNGLINIKDLNETQPQNVDFNIKKEEYVNGAINTNTKTRNSSNLDETSKPNVIFNGDSNKSTEIYCDQKYGNKISKKIHKQCPYDNKLSQNLNSVFETEQSLIKSELMAEHSQETVKTTTTEQKEIEIQYDPIESGPFSIHTTNETQINTMEQQSNDTEKPDILSDNTNISCENKNTSCENTNTSSENKNTSSENTDTSLKNPDTSCNNPNTSSEIPNTSNENSALPTEEPNATVRPIVLPGGIVMPPPRVENISTSWKTQHLTAEQVNDYCKRLFKFKTVKVMRFVRWPERRKYARARKALQTPPLPRGTTLITLPNNAQGRGRRDWVMNTQGCSYLSVFHEYVQRALQHQPVYEFQQLENASTPYQATVYIGGMQYGVGRGASKRAAKSAAARASMQVLVPGLGDWDPARADLAFFEGVGVEDPRVGSLCAAACEPSPHAVLRTCLLRNLGAAELKTQMKKLEHQKIELTMSVGKHSTTVVCKNKKTAKQRAAQSILQALHPHIKTWGSLLRLYGSRSGEGGGAARRKEARAVTSLQEHAKHNQPNLAVLNKLREEMRRLAQRDTQLAPLRTMMLDHLPTASSSELNNVDL